MLESYILLYVDPELPAYAQFFKCEAENMEHAEEQLLDAYPGVDIVWGECSSDEKQVLFNYYGEEVDPLTNSL
jgi:hypothetical protein